MQPSPVTSSEGSVVAVRLVEALVHPAITRVVLSVVGIGGLERAVCVTTAATLIAAPTIPLVAGLVR